MTKKVGVIGAGFAGMSAAALLAKHGYQVTVFEKNATPGGRASQLLMNGFTFDKGPSFYWMPDVFERFYNLFNKSASDFYKLIRLDPSYKIFWSDRDPMVLPADQESIYHLFESIEPGSGPKLNQFLSEAKIKYDVGIGQFVYLPSLTFLEYLKLDLIKNAFKLDLFTSISSHIRKYFSNSHLIQLLEFPVLFLGAKPQHTPALYSLMNYADMVLGTWHPMGGMFEVSKAFHSLGISQGAQYHFNEEVHSIKEWPDKKISIQSNHQEEIFDFVVGAADYHHIENNLLPKNKVSYNESYWSSRSLAPSTLLYFLGFDQLIPNLSHHSLFFDADFNFHAKEIYDHPAWPSRPLFYTNSSSLTDPACAPNGMHNLVALIPVAPGLKDHEEIKEKYLEMILDRIQQHTGFDCKAHLAFKKTYGYTDFITEYHSYKGNAYGLSNTLLQTGPLRPKIRSSKISNLYYCGQLTVPGPGVPPAIISGEIVANQIIQSKK